MTKEKQVKFVNAVIDAVKKDIVEKIEKGEVPEDWDGIELRWYIRDKFSEVVWGEWKNTKTKRYRDYKNAVLVNNL